MVPWKIRAQVQGREKGIDLELEFGHSEAAKAGMEAAERAGL